MFKIFLALVVFSVAAHSWAKPAKCTIEIWDYSSNSKHTVEKIFYYPANPPGELKYFNLPGSTYKCAIGFYNLDIGTNLVCFFDETEKNFVKSDRTSIKESPAKNNLIFKLNETNYGLKSLCK